jgi:hypothetical protein
MGALGFLAYTLLGATAPEASQLAPVSPARPFLVVPQAETRKQSVVRTQAKPSLAAANAVKEPENAQITLPSVPRAPALAVSYVPEPEPTRLPLPAASKARAPAGLASAPATPPPVSRPRRPTMTVKKAPKAPAAVIRAKRLPVSEPVVNTAREALAPAKPATAPPLPDRRTQASASVSMPFSKDEMTVTISGQHAWVQVSPTRTMHAKEMYCQL